MTDDDVAQWLIEEAAFLRLELEDAQSRAFPDFELPAFEPQETELMEAQRKAQHFARTGERLD